LILLAAAERSQVAAADELAMAALISAPQTRSATDAAKASNNAARLETASLAGDDDVIAAPDRSALATLYLAAARRAATLAPDRAKPIVTAALPPAEPTPAKPAPAKPAIVTTPSVAAAAAIADKSQASYSLASYSPVAPPPVALPKPAPPASAAADAPGSAIAAANALGLMGTQHPQPVNPAENFELAYASAGATATLDGATAKPRPRLNTVSAKYRDPAPAVPAVTVNAHLTTAAPGTNGLRRLMSAVTTRTRTFAFFARPRPDRVPGFYVAPKTAAEAILPTSVKPPRTDRFAIDHNRLRLRFLPPRLASLY
jgi:hypothetical protein